MSIAPANGFRTFLIVWLTQSISVFGSALTLFAVTIWLTQVLYPGPEQLRQLALAVSGVSIARAVAIVVASPLAGAWADRHDRRIIMLTMDVANGCISVVLVALIVTSALQVWMLLAILALSGCCGAFHYAAFDSSYAMLVPERHLPRANAMMQTMAELSGIISPALAAGIISLPALARQGFLGGRIGVMLSQLSNGMALTIAIDAVTFFLSAVVLAFLVIPSPRRTDLGADGKRPTKTIWADIKEGARFILDRRALLWLLASFTAANLLGSPQFVFQPLLIKFNLASDWAARNFTFETALAVMNSMASLGGVIGGLLISMWGGLKSRRVYGVLIPMVLAALAQVIFGLSPFLYLSVAMIFTTSFMIMIIRTHTQAIWQAQTPHELQGRVFAVRRLISQFTWPLGTALAGWVGGLFNPGLVLAIMGAIFLAFSLAQLLNRTLLNVESAQ
jgi:MFS transporter, DHA3 family, macrolide efflux protein